MTQLEAVKQNGLAIRKVPDKFLTKEIQIASITIYDSSFVPDIRTYYHNDWNIRPHRLGFGQQFKPANPRHVDVGQD